MALSRGDRRARYADRPGRGRVSVSRPRDRRALGAAAGRGPRAVVAARSRRAACRARALVRLSRRAARSRAPAATRPSPTCSIRTPRSIAASGSRSAVAALNTAPERRLGRAPRARACARALARGGAACRPLVPTEGLSESLVDPALAHLARKRRRRCASPRGCARSNSTGDAARRRSTSRAAARRSAPDEAVVLAVPAPVAARLVPGLDAPDEVPRHRQRALPHRAAAGTRRSSSGSSAARRNGCSASARCCRSR